MLLLVMNDYMPPSIATIRINSVRQNNEKTERFWTWEGVKQGCNLSPLLFVLVMHDVIKAYQSALITYRMGKQQFIEANELTYADDSFDDKIRNENKRGWNKNDAYCGKKKIHKASIGGTKLQQVEKYKYLGTMVKNRQSRI